MLVFRECVKKSDKTLLFDSDAIVLTNDDLVSGKISFKVGPSNVRLGFTFINGYVNYP